MKELLFSLQYASNSNLRRNLRRAFLIPTLCDEQYNTGTKSRVSIVDTVKPPITAIPNGRHMAAPCPWLIAIGIIPRIVVRVVISTGRKRLLAAVTVAFTADIPRSRQRRV